ncbi:hypothetical protein [Lysinibacillus xylanilyticus]|uniref:hypothetical protein n=1 Tax=Lysinibacillus xylanilyticus TaxID=582475 RepID=UPI0036DE14F4
MKVKLLVVCLGALVLSGCFQKVEVGPIDLPPKQSGTLVDIPQTTTNIKNIYIQYQNKFEVNTAVADFMPRGIIPGTQSPMIPLDEKDSQLQSLGFKTNISHDGEEAQLLYNDSVLVFKVGDKSLFMNDAPGIQLVDAPIYNNGTIYVPIIPILDALKIDYKIAGEDLTIGGMYTDATGEPASTEQQQ